MNRLLKNMLNKSEIIDGAIDQLKRMKAGETINLKGLHNISITRGKMTDDDIDNRILELEDERNGLRERCDRMIPEIDYGTRY